MEGVKETPLAQAPRPPQVAKKMSLVDESAYVTGKDYNALLMAFMKTKKEHSILVRAVKDEKAEKKSMTENMYKSSKLRRELEQEKKAAEEEIDRVAFENERLKRRVKAMMKQFKEQEKGQVTAEANQTSMFGKLIGSAAEVENSKLLKDIEILQEELRIKIEENECVHIKQWELQQEHEKSVSQQTSELKKLKRDVRDYEKQAVSKNKCILELGEEKERHLKRRMEVEKQFEEIQSHLAERESALKEINVNLKNDLDLARRRLKEKVIFDDSRVPEWSRLNIPPHNEQHRRKRQRSARRALNLLGQICSTFEDYSNSRGALIRLQLHHPTFSATAAPSTANPFTSEGGGGSETNGLQERIVSDLCAFSGAFNDLHNALTERYSHDDERSEYARAGSHHHGAADGAYGMKTIVRAVANIVSCHGALVESEIEHFEENHSQEEHGSAFNTFPQALQELNNGYQQLQACFQRSLDMSGGHNGGNVMDETSFFDLVLKEIMSIVRTLRVKATLEANMLQAEREQPFVPQPVRSACMQVEKSTFRVTTLAERFVECLVDTHSLFIDSFKPIAHTTRGGTMSPEKKIRRLQGSSLVAGDPTDQNSSDGKGRVAWLHGYSLTYNLMVQNLCSNLGKSIPQEMARANKMQLDSCLKNVDASEKSIEGLNTRVCVLLGQIEEERNIRKRAEEEMKLALSNFRREKEERSIVELSLNDTIRRLRQEVATLKVRSSTNLHGAATVKKESGATLTAQNVVYDEIHTRIMSSLAKNLKDIFVAIDASGDGTINQSQLKAAFGRLNIDLLNEDLSALFNLFDKNGDHNMEYDRLLSFLLHKGETSGAATNVGGPTLAPVVANSQTVQDDRVARGSGHEKTFGSLEYTMSAIDPDGRILSSLKISDEDFTREEELRTYYEGRCSQYEDQLAVASSKAKEVFSKYKDAVEKLKQLAAERTNHLQLLKQTKEAAKKAREELTATRDAMANQSQMLTSRVLSLEESEAKTKKKLSYVCAHTMRCARCHGNNRVSYVLMEGKCRTCGTDVPFSAPQQKNRKKNTDDE
jgi:hypothetical protein